MLQPVLLPTADENKRQYPIDFMLERRISHNPQASSPHVIHEQPTLSAQMGNNLWYSTIFGRCNHYTELYLSVDVDNK